MTLKQCSCPTSLCPRCPTSLCPRRDTHSYHHWVDEVGNDVWCPGFDNVTPPKSMTILSEAADIIHGDRNQSYGNYEREAPRIARLWNAYLDGKTEIEPMDVPMMMILLKVARSRHSWKRDNMVDLAGYAALAAEMAGEP